MIHSTFKLKIIKSQVGREEFPTYTLSYEMKKKSNFDGCQMSDKKSLIFNKQSLICLICQQKLNDCQISDKNAYNQQKVAFIQQEKRLLVIQSFKVE